MPWCIGIVNPPAAEGMLSLPIVRAALLDRENPSLGSWDPSMALGMLTDQCRWVNPQASSGFCGGERMRQEQPKEKAKRAIS